MAKKDVVKSGGKTKSTFGAKRFDSASASKPPPSRQPVVLTTKNKENKANNRPKPEQGDKQHLTF
jgi:hypothetical protein